MVIHVSTKYPLSAEQKELLPQNKRHWWLKRVNDDGTFVKAFPRVECDQPVDVSIDVVDGKYQLGCGDYNVVDTNGYHCSKRVYFMVANGSVKYFKTKAELDSAGLDGQTSVPESTYNPFGGSATAEQPKDIKSEPSGNVEEVAVNTDIVMFCTKDCKAVSRNYNCVVNFTPRGDGLGEDDCFTCEHGRALFYKNAKP